MELSENRYGEVPSSPVIFAACDAVYFEKFAPAFVSSIGKNTCYDIHIHVVNPTKKTFALCSYLNSQIRNQITYTFSDTDISKLNDQQVRALYACTRFMVAPMILEHAKQIMITDIDCLIMQDFDFPVEPIGYFPRTDDTGAANEWESEGMKVAAGCVYFDATAMNVCVGVAQTIAGLPLQWFNDQVALSHIFKQIPDNVVRHFDSKFMDWEFVEGTTIWTGKGPRKYENPTYVNEQESYTDMIMEDWSLKVILKPRLDIPFKQFGLTKRDSVNEPIRKNWDNFVKKLADDNTLIVESPRWMFNSEIENLFPTAKVYVPHVERHVWGGRENTMFYMQTVFPELFTIDPVGWAGGAQYVASFDKNNPHKDDAFRRMQKKLGQGKFAHLQTDNTPWDKIDDKYIIVPLQLPHDETIKYHSDFSVEEFVTQLCHMAQEKDVPQILFKGHPVNLASMEPLKKIVNGGFKNVVYIDTGNFNELVKKSTAMFVLNGGSGQEAMLHEKPVACFGRCDYAHAVINGDIKNPYLAWEEMQKDDWDARLQLYKKWYHWYIEEVCFDTKL